MESSRTVKRATSKIVGAVVLAAGLSIRMGAPKMLLPWGKTIVIRRVVETLYAAGVESIVVVVGALQAEIKDALEGLPVKLVFNPDYKNGEMIDSLRAGLNVIHGEWDGALIVLGDQPSIEVEVVQKLVTRFQSDECLLIVPSYRHRRGHPWLLDQTLIGNLSSLRAPQTMRDFLREHSQEIQYLDVDTPSVLQDMDTPEDYQNLRP